LNRPAAERLDVLKGEVFGSEPLGDPGSQLRLAVFIQHEAGLVVGGREGELAEADLPRER
jgi:hypothetical protein